jgi:hypothetical protein
MLLIFIIYFGCKKGEGSMEEVLESSEEYAALHVCSERYDVVCIGTPF